MARCRGRTTQKNMMTATWGEREKGGGGSGGQQGSRGGGGGGQRGSRLAGSGRGRFGLQPPKQRTAGAMLRGARRELRRRACEHGGARVGRCGGGCGEAGRSRARVRAPYTHHDEGDELVDEMAVAEHRVVDWWVGQGRRGWRGRGVGCALGLGAHLGGRAQGGEPRAGGAAGRRPAAASPAGRRRGGARLPGAPGRTVCVLAGAKF